MTQIKVLGRILLGTAIAVILGTVSMILVYALPMESMEKHVRESMKLYEYEDDYSAWATGAEQSKLDNFTDSIMVMNAVHPLEQGVVYSAMMNLRWGSEPEGQQTKTLLMAMNNGDVFDVPYPRYWHGYLLWLKPLLAITQIQHIRVLDSYCVFALFVIVLLMIYKRLNSSYALAFAFSVMTMNIVTISMSFQNSCIYYIVMLSVLVMLKWNDELFQKDRYPYFFAAIGILAAFFDFLTYPIASLGIPLMMWYSLNKKTFSARSLKNNMRSMFGMMAAWGVGYAGMWSGKWIMSWILTGYNTLADAVHQVGHYTIPQSESMVSAGWNITWLSAIERNISTCGNGPIRIFFFGMLIYVIYMLVSGRRKIRFSWTGFIPYMVIAALPFIWYMVCSGHSYIHAFFTYRGLSVTVFSVMCFMIESFIRREKV